MAGGSSVDAAEVARFDAQAEGWWDPDGPFRPLHRLNPTRVAVIRDMIIGRFARTETDPAPFDGLSLVDIGCGGGLIAEPMARLGARVTGIDAAPNNVATARRHAAAGGLAIDYRASTAEEVLGAGERFDVVLALEIVEHVADRRGFVASVAGLAKPGGIVILSTLNRTVKSLALGVVAAEYVLGWVPRGTHDWRKFVRPAELAHDLRRAGLAVGETAGLVFDPLSGAWRRSRDLDVNYVMSAVRG